jgi:type IV pilus assembly protein PilC
MSLFSPRIRLKPLAQFCHRLATATQAGLSDRKIWADEAERGSAAQRRAASVIRDQLAQGRAVSDALPLTGDFYPNLFRQMAAVGDLSGRLGEIYQRLARHYDRVLQTRRAFLGRLAWPLMQLGIALFVIGVLILILGMLPVNKTAAGTQVDTLGWGLVGTAGLVKYLNALLLIGILLFLLIESLRRGFGWARWLQRAAMNLPLVGGALETLALARFTWALQLVLDTSMDLRQALPLALEVTGNDTFARHAPQVRQAIERHETITTALAATGALPRELLDSIAVGEESGRLVETMAHQAREYEDRSGTAIAILAQVAGYAVWLLIAGFIIYMIFSMFSAYVNTIQSLV